MTKIDKRHFRKYLKNALIAKAVKEVLVKIRPLIESSWGKYSNYNTKTWIDGVYVDTPKTYSLEQSLTESESNFKLRELVECVLGVAAYSNRWFDNEPPFKSLYTYNSEQSDNKKVLETIDNAYNIVVEIEKEIIPKVEAIQYHKKKGKTYAN